MYNQTYPTYELINMVNTIRQIDIIFKVGYGSDST